MCWALLLVLWSQAAGEDVSSSFLSERGAWEEGGGDHISDSRGCDMVWEIVEQEWAVW